MAQKEPLITVDDFPVTRPRRQSGSSLNPYNALVERVDRLEYKLEGLMTAVDTMTERDQKQRRETDDSCFSWFFSGCSEY